MRRPSSISSDQRCSTVQSRSRAARDARSHSSATTSLRSGLWTTLSRSMLCRGGAGVTDVIEGTRVHGNSLRFSLTSAAVAHPISRFRLVELEARYGVGGCNPRYQQRPRPTRACITREWLRHGTVGNQLHVSPERPPTCPWRPSRLDGVLTRPAPWLSGVTQSARPTATTVTRPTRAPWQRGRAPSLRAHAVRSLMPAHCSAPTAVAGSVRWAPTWAVFSQLRLPRSSLNTARIAARDRNVW